MSSIPKISVVVPIYNVEVYLHKCLKSIQDQTLTDIEVICVNDGSTDQSLRIIEEFVTNDKRFKVINKSNSGYGHTVNMGMDEARGEYVGIVESDDFIAPDMYETLYHYTLDKAPEIVKGDFFYYWSTPSERVEPAKILSKKPHETVISAVQYDSLFDAPPSLWSAIYLKSFLQENKIRLLETAGASFQDTSFTFKVLACANKLVLTPKEILYYRQDNVNSSVKSNTKIFNICDEINEMEKFLQADPNRLRQFKEIFIRRKFIAYLWNFLRLDQTGRKTFFSFFRDECREIVTNNDIFNLGLSTKYLCALWLIAKMPILFKSVLAGFLR